MMKNGKKPIKVEHTFATSIKTLWNAITDIKQMRQWYFRDIPAFKPEVGFKTQFNVQSQGRNFLHQWEVTEVIPFNRIVYNWKYEGYAGDSNVCFELFKQDHRTRLKLTHHILEDFPQNIPEFSRESCAQGWIYFISKSLKDFLYSK